MVKRKSEPVVIRLKCLFCFMCEIHLKREDKIITKKSYATHKAKPK